MAALTGHPNRARECPLLGDTVEKVENSAAPKISRRLVFVVSAAASVCRTGTRTYGRFCVNRCCCLAIQRRYEGPWSILDELIWSLTSPRVRRINGSKKFRSSPQKDFFNTIGAFRTCRGLTMSALGGGTDIPQQGRDVRVCAMSGHSRCRHYSDGMVVRRLALKSSALLVPGVGVINSSARGGTISAITCLVAPGLPSSVDCTANSDRTNREARADVLSIHSRQSP